MTDERVENADRGSTGPRGGPNLRLLVELTPHHAPDGDRRFTAREIAVGVHDQRSERGLDDIAVVIEALLTGSSEVIPDDLVAPLAAFFAAPVADLTDDPLLAETAILERLVVERGAAGVLFCREHLDRSLANRLLRAVLGALGGDGTTGLALAEHPP